MKTIVSAREIEDLLRNGGDVKSLPSDAIFTPSARDLLREFENNGVSRSFATPEKAAPARPVTPASPKSELEAFFNSPELHALKLQICDVGRRLWSRAYVDGNGGNIAIRVGDNLALCTPTLVSKGFMKPEDMCLVDLEGNQLAGTKKRTSEILMHLQIMKRQPRAKATVHCHPPHATAFAVAGVEPPTCMIPEIEVFIGKVPLAPYRTPGTPEMGKLVADLTDNHNTVLMANHGVVSWSHVSVEDAYFKMEIIEAYCRTVVVAAQLGSPLKTFSNEHLQDLLKIKQTLGIPDSRFGLKECELCNNDEWRPGVTCAIPPREVNNSANGADAEAEALVQAITGQVMSRLKQ
jgi:L-fuculose-phosphate aldolase